MTDFLKHGDIVLWLIIAAGWVWQASSFVTTLTSVKEGFDRLNEESDAREVRHQEVHTKLIAKVNFLHGRMGNGTYPETNGE